MPTVLKDTKHLTTLLGWSILYIYVNLDHPILLEILKLFILWFASVLGWSQLYIYQNLDHPKYFKIFHFEADSLPRQFSFLANVLTSSFFTKWENCTLAHVSLKKQNQHYTTKFLFFFLEKKILPPASRHYLWITGRPSSPSWYQSYVLQVPI